MKGCPHHGMKWIQPDTIEVIDPATGDRREVRNSNAGQCLACRKFNSEHGGRHRQPKRERKDKGYQGRYLVMPDGSVDRPKYMRKDGTADAKELSKYLGVVLSDPVRTLGFFSENAHQKGVSRSQYGIAIRRANREPMLNGDPRQITNALDSGAARERNSRLPKMGVFKRIVVKPDSLATGKVAGWHERLWTIHRLKYAKGLVIVTDTGTESRIFPSWGEMESAIRKSGWRIIK